MVNPVIEKDSDLYWHVRSIVEDHDRGASAIGRDLRKHLVPFKGTADEGREIARTLIQAKPVMAPILHVANHLLGGPEPPAAAQGLGASGLALVTPGRAPGAKRDPSVEDAVHRIERVAAGEEKLRVMTYSASGTVEAVLDSLQESGRLKEVLLSEAQPGGEGRSLAARLAAEWGPRDAQVTLTHDAALPALMADIDVFLIGADLMLPRGIVNKVGTSVLVERAARNGVPVIVAAAADKAPPRGIRSDDLPLPLTTKAGQLSDPPTGVATLGLAFEWVEVPKRALPPWGKGAEVPEAVPQLVNLLREVRARLVGEDE